MRYIILLLTIGILFASLNTSAQAVITYETQNLNIGFGKADDCATNQYLDFCVNGPLVEKSGLPVGGYIDNGVQTQDWSNPADGGGNFGINNGILGLGTDGKLYLVSYNTRDQLPEMKWAIQNGPILVQDKVNVRGSSQTKYIRSGIGYRNDGALVVIVSLEPVTFRDFAELFTEKDCVSALYLDGGPYVGYSDNKTKNGMVDEAIKLQFYNN